MKNNKIFFGSLVDIFGYNRVNYCMNLSIKYNYIYYETPKAGCSTIKRRLQLAELIDTPFSPPGNVHDKSSSPLLSPSQLSRSQINNFLNDRKFVKFCFVRNPFTRVLSAYLDKIVRNEPQKMALIKSTGMKDSDVNIEISFFEFLKMLEKNDRAKMDPHWSVQFVHLMCDKIDYNFIGKFETFEKDWDVLLRILFDKETRDSLKNESMRYHKTNANDRISDFYDGKCVDLVRKIYKDDFVFFKYDEDVECNIN